MPTPIAHAATNNAMIHQYFRRENFIAPTRELRLLLAAGGDAGNGLIVEIGPLSFPNRSTVLRGRRRRWKRPNMMQIYQTPAT
jgi:hypothetical protein